MYLFSQRRGVTPLLSLVALVFLSACGGSPPNSPRPPSGSTPPPINNNNPTWTSGVFAPASDFKDRCQAPRTGVDAEGNAFPDRSGSTLLENFWLRSWTNETYLWNTEVVDRNPAGFSDRLAYFDVLKTTATTPSGKDKDEFHFTVPTDEFLAQRLSAPKAGYGASFVAISSTVPRDFRIRYTEANTPATQIVGGQVNFQRGTKILEVDGVDLVNATSQADIDTLNAGLFPDNANESHTFLVQDPGSALTRTVIITSADLSTKPVNRFSVLNTPTGDVGYIVFNTFSPFASEKEIADTINALSGAGVSDLVLDLRYNGGGLLAVASQLSYMIAGSARTSGKTFELLRFNAAAGNRNPVTGQVNDPVPFYTTGLGFSVTDGAPLSSLNLNRVFILTTEDTCSASEAVINGLRGIDVEVILIGSKTCGKPFGFYPQDNCGETYFTVQFQGVNDKSFGDYADGFVPTNSVETFGVRTPGCAVADDLSKDLGDTSEVLLAAALQYRSTGSCPTPTAVSGPTITVSSVSAPSLALEVPEVFLRGSRDMTMPNN